MTSNADISGYSWNDAGLTNAHSYLLPKVIRELDRLRNENEQLRMAVFELGCGNGSVAAVLSRLGWDVTGVDPSEEGIAQANASYPELKLYQGSAYDDLAAKFGRFPVVTSLEVVEHVYAPRRYAATLYSLVESQGSAIVSTPYHGYWKNLAIAVAGRMDRHYAALWDHGHIKFWSVATLGQLLSEAGFIDIRFYRVGRVPALAKSMIAIARRP